jgi:hypothetical protein
VFIFAPHQFIGTIASCSLGLMMRMLLIHSLRFPLTVPFLTPLFTSLVFLSGVSPFFRLPIVLELVTSIW